MQPGDLVELCNEQDDMTIPSGIVCVAKENAEQTANNRYIAVGTLAVYLWERKKKSANDEAAVAILVDGQVGWVWQGEIRSATHSSLTDTSMMVPSTAVLNASR